MKFSTVISLLLLAATVQARPNVLIIIGDDCTYNDLAVYGGPNAHTPHIDRLAREGLVFNRAYVSESICQPCRSELYTGQYPLRNGSAWNHSSSRDGTRSLPHYLTPLGYRVGLTGKVHVKPKAVYPFEDVPGFDPSCVRDPTRAHDLAGIQEFMTREKNPFCLVVALTEPHVPWVMGDASQYPIDQIELPANLADTPQTRTDFAAYLAEITYMDSQIGEILSALDATGKADDTLVLFTSEQGSQFPGNKWNTWDTGLHTGLIAKWPGHVPAGRRTDAITRYADIAPTLIDLAGGSDEMNAGPFDGKSLAHVLAGETDSHHEFAFGLHNNIPEGPPYPMRTVSNGDHRYVRNLLPDELYLIKWILGYDGERLDHTPYWPSWGFTAGIDDQTYALTKRLLRRPAEELYHTAHDPYELVNLANDPKFAAIKTELAQHLDQWMQEQGDPGAAMDTRDVHQAARNGTHLYHPH
ncbi:MAG: sulfatase [Synoicihabitans sp.]